MDQWDYLNKGLAEWLDDFTDSNSTLEDVLVEITAEYLPSLRPPFTGIVHRNPGYNRKHYECCDFNRFRYAAIPTR